MHYRQLTAALSTILQKQEVHNVIASCNEIVFCNAVQTYPVNNRSIFYSVMNVVYPPSNPVVAKTCGCREKGKQKVTYAFSDDFHSLCIDKGIIQAEIEACEKLLKYATTDSGKATIEKEITDLKTALDFMS